MTIKPLLPFALDRFQCSPSTPRRLNSFASQPKSHMGVFKLTTNTLR